MSDADLLTTKMLILDGEGFKARIVGTSLRLELNQLQTIALDIPPNLGVRIDAGGAKIILSSPDKEVVTNFANVIRWKRPPNFYGRGIRFEDEKIPGLNLNPKKKKK
jgi:large subunit ribosomal protein L6